MNAFVFFLQVTGFALQCVPVALLMCVPFSDAELRYSRKKTYAILIAAGAAASIGFGFAEYALSGSDDDIKQYANLYMLLFIVVEFGIYFFFVRANILNRLLMMIILIHYAAVLFTCSNIVMRLPFLSGFFNGASNGMVYTENSNKAFLIVTAVTFPVVFLFLRRVVRPAINIADSKAMKRGFVYFILALVIYCVTSVIFDFNSDRSVYNNPGVITLFAAFIVTDFIMCYMFFFETKLIMENSRLMDRIQSFDEQYRRISRDVEESRRLRHDLCHHLSAIGTMNRNGETKELSEYLEAYSAVYAELDDIVLCGYHALDNILRYYLSVAKQKGITVNTRLHSVSSDMAFDVTDITVLVGNLMENAIEACEELTDSETFIRISIKQSGASLLIKEENSCRMDVEPQSEFTGSDSFVSTKHTTQPGRGLKSIAIVAEKYGGTAEFKRENGIFTARAVLNIP